MPVNNKTAEFCAEFTDIRAGALESLGVRISTKERIPILVFIEAGWVTGPAKNLIEFARWARQQAESDLKLDIVIATFHREAYGPIGESEFIKACVEAGLKIIVIRERFTFDMSIISQIKKLIKAHNPAIIQTHAVKSHFLIWLTSAYQNRRWVAFHHGYTWQNWRMRVYNHLDRCSLSRASKVVTVCQPFAEDLVKIGVQSEKIVIRHNSVRPFQRAESAKVLELRRALNISERMKVALCIGRLSQEKGHADLIAAVAHLRRDLGNEELRIVMPGHGGELKRLQEFASSHSIRDWFIFTGHVADLTAYYSLADLVVMPSHTEGSPNVLLEAMAAGVPVVATRVGGIPEIVTNEKDALLVDSHNPVELSAAIERLLRDDELRGKLSEAGRKTVLAYSPSSYCKFMLSLYQSLDKELN